MAIHIHFQGGRNDIDSTNLTSKEEIKLQYMPCKITADCKADVLSYFMPYIQTKDNTNYSSSFRGYPLVGQKVNVPKGYTGMVFHERLKPETDKDDRKFFVIQNFHYFMYWNFDKVTSKNDPIWKAIDDWIDLAEALHAPVIDDE